MPSALYVLTNAEQTLCKIGFTHDARFAGRKSRETMKLYHIRLWLYDSIETAGDPRALEFAAHRALRLLQFRPATSRKGRRGARELFEVRPDIARDLIAGLVEEERAIRERSGPGSSFPDAVPPAARRGFIRGEGFVMHLAPAETAPRRWDHRG